MIDAPATFNRVMSWMSYAYQMEGELYWGTNAADTDFSTDPKNSSWEQQCAGRGLVFDHFTRIYDALRRSARVVCDMLFLMPVLTEC